MAQVWLVSGSGRGLGRAIVEAALAAGHKVVAGARDVRQLADLVQQYRTQIYPVTLDVTDPAQAEAAVADAVEEFGRLDVLINNAGYGHVAPFETASPASVRDQIETNLFGVINLTRAALPVMRAQRAGHVIQISSVGGRVATPGVAAYQTAKWAVGGFSEVVQMEVAHLGIKVTTMEPGGMRTNWAQTARGNLAPMPDDYQPTVGHISELLSQYAGNESGDPARVAQIVLRVAGHPAAPVHLLLGSDAVHLSAHADAARAASAEQWRAVSLSADFGAGEIPPLPDVAGVSWDVGEMLAQLEGLREG